ncbi:MAG: hypothetical protein AWU57_4555 [Marinobacter sp. T13-3]|nr:MAG: hypothetical protein AWU57_4555 [Marinobacter sp. T13-3]
MVVAREQAVSVPLPLTSQSSSLPARGPSAGRPLRAAAYLRVILNHLKMMDERPWRQSKAGAFRLRVMAKARRLVFHAGSQFGFLSGNQQRAQVVGLFVANPASVGNMVLCIKKPKGALVSACELRIGTAIHGGESASNQPLNRTPKAWPLLVPSASLRRRLAPR